MVDLCYNVAYRYKMYLKHIYWRTIVMPNYKEMYFKMLRASDKAIATLLQAQLECEECYLSANEPRLVLLEEKNEQEKS